MEELYITFFWNFILPLVGGLCIVFSFEVLGRKWVAWRLITESGEVRLSPYKRIQAIEPSIEPLCFIVRKSDGKFYRGARFWRWTKKWKHAALLTPEFTKQWLAGPNLDIENINDIEFCTVQTTPTSNHTWSRIQGLM